MTDFVTIVLRFAVRGAILALGLVFVASLLMVAMALAILWGLRALWAKLTGQPITPWVMRMNPSAGWSRASQAASRWQQPTAQPLGSRTGPNRDLADITDVKAKEL